MAGSSKKTCHELEALPGLRKGRRRFGQENPPRGFLDPDRRTQERRLEEVVRGVDTDEAVEMPVLERQAGAGQRAQGLCGINQPKSRLLPEYGRREMG